MSKACKTSHRQRIALQTSFWSCKTLMIVRSIIKEAIVHSALLNSRYVWAWVTICRVLLWTISDHSLTSACNINLSGEAQTTATPTRAAVSNTNIKFHLKSLFQLANSSNIAFITVCTKHHLYGPDISVPKASYLNGY